MLRSLWILFVFLAFIGLGFQTPFVLTLGYVWVDTFRPQDVSYIILNQVPVAMIVGSLAIVLYAMFDHRDPPRLRLITVLQVAFAIWVTLTTTWAAFPDDAWAKWSWAVKTILFSAFIPFAIRSRIQIEAFLQVYMFSLAANLIPFGVKMVISGGGYGQNLGLAGGNSGLAEGSTLAAVSIMTIPVYLFLRQHSIIAPKAFWFRSIYLGLAVLSGLTSLGTFERTGLVGLVVLGILMFLKSRRKVLTLFVGLVAALAVAYTTSDAWTSRISTISDFQTENSALARLLVWRWTVQFATEHPLGGGFDAYHLDHVEFENGEMKFGVAFHSIYFEVLGEHGWIGLALFVSLAILSLIALQKAAKEARRHPELQWCSDLAGTIQISLIVMMVCGSFVGIAFQPMIHYLFAMAVCVSEYVRRAVLTLQPADKPTRAWAPRLPMPREGHTIQRQK
nr:putative O-glycosylation ligase, exosortase A system-associated [uncultured Rhodopila sp.]